ncbi:HTH-type transcriptional regulator CysB [Methylomarinum vadi]|uniref:HTH-type transcriptional regulator CysB n=1 Tax=Methylomarinum vadi TaxID=438855 RepID=UPI00068B1E9D|nr:HTH-type transcriptional regulator CysB [Methylomarinum vadi]
MKLQQLRYLCEIERQNMNISKAAAALFTSQSGVSKQIQLLEQELNVQLFRRKGKHLLAFSEAGEKVLYYAKEALQKVENIRLLADELNRSQQSLTLATTHTQARYVLPKVVEQFLRVYPAIDLHLHQGTPSQIADMLERGEVDIAIATEALADREALLSMPCYQWSRSIITRQGHPLTQLSSVALADVARYPIITYVQGFTGREQLDETFRRERLQPDFVLTAVDADVIKTYVRLGLGIGIIADMAFHPDQDRDLQALNAKNLFGVSTSRIAIKRDKYIKDYVFRFIEMFAPHLSADVVKQALLCSNNAEAEKLFADFVVPIYRPPKPSEHELQ